MKYPYFHLFWVALAALMLIAGCVDDSPKSDDTGDSENDTSTETDSETNSNTETDSDTGSDSDLNGDYYSACESAPVLSDEAQAVMNASDRFGMALFKEIVSRAEGENVSISPLSLHEVWSMLYTGTRGEAADELREALGLSEVEMDTLTTGYQEIISQLNSVDEAVQLMQANSLWVEDDLTEMLLPSFSQTAQESFNAEVTAIDFAGDDALDTINGWVSDHTNDKIEELLSGIPANAALILLNALYFNAPWTYTFDPPNEQGFNRFHRADDTYQEVDMMTVYTDLRFYETDEFAMVELPYGNGIFAMSVIVPDVGVDMDSFVANLNEQKFTEWHNNSYTTMVQLTLPKFELDFDAINDNDDLFKSALNSIGINKVFESSSEYLSGVLDLSNGTAAVDKVKHKTFLSVSEEGTEAAAASAIVIVLADGAGGPEKWVIADHPFLFAIHNRCTGGIVFMGQVNEIPETDTPELML